MSVTFPVSNPFRFATNMANWTLITAASKISGWIGGDPVPAGKNNILFGTITDWVTWVMETTVTDVVYPLGFAEWTVTQDVGTALFTTAVDAPYSGTDPINASVELKILNDNFIKFRTAVGVKAGEITGAAVIVTAASFDDCTMNLFVYDELGALLGTFTNGSVSLGTVTLTGTDTVLDGAAYAIFEVDLGETSGQLVEVTRLQITYGAP